ncbi:FagA protein, partial [Pseudomonas aeruginosa]
MSFEAHDPQALDHWYWLGTQIRCALDPDEPRCT